MNYFLKNKNLASKLIYKLLLTIVFFIPFFLVFVSPGSLTIADEEEKSVINKVNRAPVMEDLKKDFEEWLKSTIEEVNKLFENPTMENAERLYVFHTFLSKEATMIKSNNERIIGKNASIQSNFNDALIAKAFDVQLVDRKLIKIDFKEYTIQGAKITAAFGQWENHFSNIPKSIITFLAIRKPNGSWGILFNDSTNDILEGFPEKLPEDTLGVWNSYKFSVKPISHLKVSTWRAIKKNLY